MCTTDVNGFTLLELLAVLAVLSLLLMTGLPALSNSTDKARLSRAAETLASDLRLAQQLAITRQQAVYITFSIQSPGCYAISDQAHCPCNDLSHACITSSSLGRHAARYDASHFKGLELYEARFGASNYTRFDPQRGTARFGHVRLRDAHNRQLQLNVSLLGRIRICVAGNGLAFSGYPAC